MCGLGQGTPEVHCQERQRARRGEHLEILLVLDKRPASHSTRSAIPYGRKRVAGHVRPVVLPAKGVVHTGRSWVTCQSRMLCQVQYPGAQPSRYHALESPVQRGSPHEKSAPVDMCMHSSFITELVPATVKVSWIVFMALRPSPSYPDLPEHVRHSKWRYSCIQQPKQLLLNGFFSRGVYRWCCKLGLARLYTSPKRTLQPRLLSHTLARPSCRSALISRLLPSSIAWHFKILCNLAKYNS